ncbi:NAD(P)H-dependent flavin oxidoreductase [Tepidibacter formicigenes]|uniref:Probable nitronate monooxygenase n=1 Tax=Tepidibacter formicigenes DSM 15518 TaxID=1123349 RepID=A0A1M6RQ57_9FIRM|nr:nitronate monooxygenase [Tepidibacter formicigenes]SHK34651.1 NAD(P)H-dependent flavin oxidoreductase YrpB, nitropropane dioxygenase family [Tepidibacter formicigenes DSM 15518]
MRLPSLNIGELIAKIPIIQGGMGIGVSRSSLAAAVANEGGIGVISGAQIGFEEEDFRTNNKEANIRALKREIKRARELSPNGIIGVNFLVAMENYKEMVMAAVEEKINLIISGAGLPKNLPEMIKGSKTKIAPIVSSGKAAALISKLWDRKYNYIPDLVIVEGPKAGGHLGYSMEELDASENIDLVKVVKDVIDSLKSFKEKYKKDIPVIAAGGIFDGTDIAKYIKAGAAGVQMGTRFVATHECDADIEYKKAYVNSKKEDIKLIKSPVGLPGRAINNKFVEKTKLGNIPIKKCYRCIVTCNPKTTPYCITEALIDAVKGDVDNGLIFSGSNAYKLDEIISVKELMSKLLSEAQLALE